MIKNGEITTWDDVFTPIFSALQQTITHPLSNVGLIRAGALKAMKELWFNLYKLEFSVVGNVWVY